MKKVFDFHYQVCLIDFGGFICIRTGNGQKKSSRYKNEIEKTYDNGAITCDNELEINVNIVEKRIVEFCIISRTIHEIMEFLVYRERKTVRRHIKPLIEQ